jgi:hypothetical protein
MNNYKITFIVSGNRITTEKKEYTKMELNLLNTLLKERNEIEDLNIILKSKRRAGNNKYFVDFESTNNFTILENLNNYLDIESYEEIYNNTINFNKNLLNELNKFDLK